MHGRAATPAKPAGGLHWALLAKATDPSAVWPAAMLVAGLPRFWSVVRVTAVDPDGQVHLVQLDEGDPAVRRLLDRVGAA